MRAPTISRVINQLKGYVTKQLGYSIWQKLFHDQIIRDEAEYQRIWQYINENPEKWEDVCQGGKCPLLYKLSLMVISVVKGYYLNKPIFCL